MKNRLLVTFKTSGPRPHLAALGRTRPHSAALGRTHPYPAALCGRTWPHFWPKNKYGSKGLKLPNSSRNAIKKIWCGIVRPHCAVPHFRTVRQMRKVMKFNLYIYGQAEKQNLKLVAHFEIFLLPILFKNCSSKCKWRSIRKSALYWSIKSRESYVHQH